MTRNTRARSAVPNPNPEQNPSEEIAPPRRQGRVQFQDLAAIHTCNTVQDDIKKLLTAMHTRFEHERYLVKIEAEVKRMEKKIHALDLQINKLFQNITSVRPATPLAVSVEAL